MKKTQATETSTKENQANSASEENGPSSGGRMTPESSGRLESVNFQFQPFLLKFQMALWFRRMPQISRFGSQVLVARSVLVSSRLCLSKPGSVHHTVKHMSVKPPPYWDYTEKYGPDYWVKEWPTNNRQSPIDILTKLASYDPSLTKYNIDKTPLRLNLKNFGLNVTITPNDDLPIILTGGGLRNDTYRFREFHFHWADGVNECGCEHTLNGQRFAAELHIVHWNCKRFETEIEALSGADGLAVLGVLLDAHQSYQDNASLNALLKMIQNVQYKDDEHTSEDVFTPYALLPDNTNDYFTYPGSLTTPPLTENVTWTVFRKPLKISTTQLSTFTSLFAVSRDEKSQRHDKDLFTRKNNIIPQPPTIGNNYRPVQKLHDRIIYSSFDPNA